MSLDSGQGQQNVVVLDYHNHFIRSVAKEGTVVSTLAGNGKVGFTDGQGPNARFNNPCSVVVPVNGDFIVSYKGNHSIHVPLT
jgi:hypothetical protein